MRLDVKARALLIAVTLLVVASSALAQALSQGRVTSDGAVIWRIDSSVPLLTVQNGDVLEVTGQSQRWYEVRVPARLGGRAAVGLIARTQLQLEPGAPAPPMKTLRGDPPPAGALAASLSRSGQPAARRTPRPFPSGYFAAGVAMQTRAQAFEHGNTFETNVETGDFRTQYAAEDAWGLNVAVAQTVRGALAIGGAVDVFTRATPGTFSASIPHPFFFGTPRVVSGDVEELNQTDLNQSQLGLHFQVRGLWFVGPRLQVTVGGGPSLFYVKQTVVTDFTHAETYPYDVVTLQNLETSEADAWRLGFNVTSGAAYYFTRRVGIGIDATYSRGDLTIDVPDGSSLELRAGGVTAGAGVRVKF
jgi:hypothetical protein